jgi:hypothetical protein
MNGFYFNDIADFRLPYKLLGNVERENFKYKYFHLANKSKGLHIRFTRTW